MLAHPPPPSCPLCGSARTRTAAALRSDVDGKEYDAVRCRACGLLFVSPVPNLSFADLQRVYDAEYTAELREWTGDDRAREILRAATHRQMEIVERHVPKGAALNVGAMSDASLVLKERGWTLQVVDVSRHAAETARDLWGIDVAVSRLEDFERPAGSLDFVKLGHVIEHLADPLRAMQRVASMLRPGGAVLIDTDNAEGFRSQIEFAVRRVLGERLAAGAVRAVTGKNLHARYGRLIPPVHWYTFSKTALTRLVSDAGFEVEEMFTPAWGDPTWFPLTRARDFSAVERAFLLLDRLGARFGRGEVVAVLAIKR